MENAIRRIIKQIIEEPLLKSVVEEELKEHYSQNDNSDSHSDKVDYKVKIDGNYHLSFTNYPDIEIPSYQAQALYIFYLLAPHGISNRELLNYEEILIKVYKLICKYKIGDDYRAQGVIHGMLIRKGGISDATNKIRKAFKKAISDKELFEQYIISGDRKGKRLIRIPKEEIRVESDSLLELKEEIKLML